MTLDADRRRLERAALTDPGEAARAHGRERLRALATVPVEQQAAALTALIQARPVLNTYEYERGVVGSPVFRDVEYETKHLIREALKWEPNTLMATCCPAGYETVLVLVVRLHGSDAIVVGVAPVKKRSRTTELGSEWPRRAWPEVGPKPARASTRSAALTEWALRLSDDRVMMSLKAAEAWAGPSPDAVTLTGSVDPSIGPIYPTYVQVAMQASPGTRGSLELRLGDRVERRTFPPEAPTP